jgi:hypothetical protein
MNSFFSKIALLSALSLSAHAGTMGAIITPPYSHPFVSAEGGYTWSKIDGLHINVVDIVTLNSNKSRHGGSARLAAGLEREIGHAWMMSGEIGYGYYGYTSTSPRAAGPLLDMVGAPNFSAIHMKFTQDGFDALAGIIYHQPAFDLFFKAGALVQNSHRKLNIDLGSLIGVDLNGKAQVKMNQTEVMPEIKLGGAYHVTENFSILGSWTHAFGANSKIQANLNIFNPIGSINIDLENPTLNVLMVGLQYNFA